MFGRGLATGTLDAAITWNRLVNTIVRVPASAQRPEVLGGYLYQLRLDDLTLTDTLLDASSTANKLLLFYPFLQATSGVDAAGVTRLKAAVGSGDIPASAFKQLAYGRATDPIPAEDLRDLLLAINAMPDGADVAIEILHMRLHSDCELKVPVAAELTEAAHALLGNLTFAKSDQDDYRLSQIVKACLTADKSAPLARELSENLRIAVGEYKTYAFHHNDFVDSLFATQPIAALDGLFGREASTFKQGLRVINQIRDRTAVLDRVSEDTLVQWCQLDPDKRYSGIASLITITHQTQDGLQWSGIAMRLLRESPHPEAVLDAFVEQFSPHGGWTGSPAATLETHLALLDALTGFPQLADAIAQQKERVRKAIDAYRKSEFTFSREHDQRFE